MNCPTTIIINPYCHQGKGWDRWKDIRSGIMAKMPGACSVVLEKGVSLSSNLNNLLGAEPSYLISAGGDGSVHHLLNTLVREHPHQLKLVKLGAIGLGSSNDFIKPVRSMIRNIPVRINDTHLIEHDLGMIDYRDEAGIMRSEYFIINMSMGVTAFGNWVFNNPGTRLAFLKRFSTPLAIAYTALISLLSFKNTRCRIDFEDQVIDTDLTNLNILKLPYVSGNFRYNQKIDPDDGTLSLNLCHGMGIFRKMMALYKLGNGKLLPGDHVISARTDRIEINANQPFLFECDGETFRSDKISVSVLPKMIKVAQN